jgi:pimeloyl-ACP methyl ester carboxylesterase
MILAALKLALLAYVGFGAFLYLAQRELMYLPVSDTAADGVPVEYVENDGERLKLWRLGPRDAASAVLYFGGNAENVLLEGPTLSRVLPGKALYLVNYRGYGGSTGKPSETALYDDAVAVFDHVVDRHASISVIGRSLGSGVGVYLAGRRPVARLVLVTPFDSLVEVARALYPLYPVDWLIRDRFDSADHAADVEADILLLVAGRDRITPPARAHALADALADACVELVTLAQAGHNTISADPRYWREIARFLDPPVVTPGSLASRC